jgi:hypothetical protein
VTRQCPTLPETQGNVATYRHHPRGAGNCANQPPPTLAWQRTATTPGARGTARQAHHRARVVTGPKGLFGPPRTTGRRGAAPARRGWSVRRRTTRRWGAGRGVPRAPGGAPPEGSQARRGSTSW